MDALNGARGRFRSFKRSDFEADWIKVAERRFGNVHRVKLKLWREECALKIFDTNPPENTLYRRMVDEAKEIAKGKTKYIVSIYGLCSDPAAVVMEFMANGSLDLLLTSHILMWPKKFQMIHETTMGMNYLHSAKPPILHLNLKTSNLLLDGHLHVKISDFGLIKWVEGPKKFMEHLTARGNISYIPPEMFIQCPDAPGTAFDVYSFAIVMWEILTQQKPYPGSSITTVLVRVSRGKRPRLENIPEKKPQECDQMVGIMERCWDQDPKQRPLFSDTARKTEALSEVLQIPGVSDAHGNLGQRQDHRLLSPISMPDTPDLPSGSQCGNDDVLLLLSKKDFQSFRKLLRREHTSMLFSDKNSLLHYTVASEDVMSVQSLLSLGADANCHSARGYTPLIIAVLRRLHEIVVMLLEHGAAANQADEDQWTPLHFASQNGDDTTVRLLLDNGAVPSAKEKAGWIPLHLACQNGHEAVVRLLLSRLSKDAIGEREQMRGRTPLHLACMYGHLEIAKLLLYHGADPNTTDGSLSTALHLSAEEGHNRVVRQLVKGGAQTNSVDTRGYTPLHLAAVKGHTGICRQLLANGAKADPRTLQGWTPIHLAALKGQAATALQIESQGGSVNARGESEWTPLHLACYHGHEEVVAQLLAAKADPNVTETTEGWTPLHLACSSCTLVSVLQLISHRADVNAANWSKAAPLHLAAQRGCVPIVQALLQNGADRTVQDSTGSTALDVAQKSEIQEVVQLLLQ